MTSTATKLDEALLVEIEGHAVELARGAGAILSGYFGHTLDIEFKDKKESDPVTNADKESQEYLRKAILEKFPEHGVLGEEDEEDESPAKDFLWVLDPLDGTKNFMNGLPIYASSIGVLHKGAPIVGAVYIPWPSAGGSVVMHARKGGGAFADDDPIAVFGGDEPAGSRLMTLPGSFGAFFGFDKPMREKSGELRVSGSIAYELAMTARGVLQYAVTTGPHLWDVAGGVILIQEAGGVVMRRKRSGGFLGLSTATHWEPMDSLVPSWESGKTTLKELRQWRASMISGGPAIVRYVTSNTRARRMLRWRLWRATRRLLRRKK